MEDWEAEWDAAEHEAVQREAREEMEAELTRAHEREPWTWAREDAAEHAGEAAYMAAFG